MYDRKVIEYLETQGFVVKLLQLPRRPYLIAPFHNFHAPVRRLFRDTTPERYDCIVIDELTHPSVFFALSRRKYPHPPVVVLLHHLKIRERIGSLLKIIARAMERSLLHNGDAVIVNSRTTQNTVEELLGRKTAVYVSSPGSDTFKLDAAEGAIGTDEHCRTENSTSTNGQPPVRLLITGNVIPRKGHDLLVEILSELPDLSWELRVVGSAVDNRYKTRLDRFAERNGLSARIVYLGVLPEQALRREYLEADIFVFPSRYEGFGISLAEAIRAGLPFVAFATGAIPEVCGDRGLLVAEGDLSGFRQHLRRLIFDRAFREQQAEISSELAATLPTWKHTGQEFLRALREIMEQDKSK